MYSRDLNSEESFFFRLQRFESMCYLICKEVKNNGQKKDVLIIGLNANIQT